MTSFLKSALKSRSISSRIMSTQPTSSLNFSLNPRLEKETPSPPVPLAAKWAQSFPLSTSPFHPSNSTSSDPTQVNTKSLLNLAQGVPGHAPPQPLISKMESEFKAQPPDIVHGYMHVFGEPKLREALAQDLRVIYGAGKERLNSENVALTSGCNLAFAVVAQSLSQTGDRAILPSPWVSSYPTHACERNTRRWNVNRKRKGKGMSFGKCCSFPFSLHSSLSC